MIALKYDSQISPQDLYLEVSANDAAIGIDGEIGNAITERVFNNRALRFNLYPSCCSEKEAEAFLEENQDLIERLQASYDEEWDGQRYIGHWNDFLVEELERECEQFTSEWSFVSAGEYFYHVYKRIIKRLKEIGVELLEEELEKELFNDKVLLWGLNDYLEEIQRLIKLEENEE